MSRKLRTKAITAFLAIVVSMALVATFAGIDALAPKASLLGFIIRAVVLAGIVPVALIGFNALCDKCTLPSNRNSSEDLTAQSATFRKNNPIRNNQRQYKTPDRGAAIIAVHEEAMPAGFPVYHVTRFSVPVPKDKWWVGQ